MTIDSSLDPATYLDLWQLADPFLLANTQTSTVWRVRQAGEECVLKLLKPDGMEDEGLGGEFLRRCNGKGAIRLLANDPGAHLLEFADGVQLRLLVVQGNDTDAAAIAARTVAAMHTATPEPDDGFADLHRRFHELWQKAEADRANGYETVFTGAADCTRELLTDTSRTALLHGDVHHDNILHHAKRGWLAIDPKGLLGDPHYDVANLFCNPFDMPEICCSAKRIERLTDMFTDLMGFDRERVLGFAFGHAALSSCWTMLEGGDPSVRLAVADLLWAEMQPMAGSRPRVTNATTPSH